MLSLLSLIIIIPILGSLALLGININNVSNNSISFNNSQIKLKQVALITSLINFFISLLIWFNFDSNISQYQFVLEIKQLELFDLNFGIDGISLYFVLLTTFVTPIALLSNYSNIIGKEAKYLKFFLISILLLETLQICAFVSLDLILFYIFFESVKCFGSTLLCLQLSNSGDTLKLMIPSYSWKTISGWSNYSGMVTSHKMKETEMGNRGSKSVLTNTVKEQRVDGSYFGLIKFPKLRCTLMGYENSYQISNPSNQIYINNFKLRTKMFLLNRSFYTQTNNLFTYYNFNKQFSTAEINFLKPSILQKHWL